MFTMVNAMQWAVVQRVNVITLVMDKDDKGIIQFQQTKYCQSTVMGILYMPSTTGEAEA